MTSQMKTTVNDMSAAEMQEALEDLYEHIEDLKEERKEIMSEIDMKMQGVMKYLRF